jgi:carbon starvation protein CstA
MANISQQRTLLKVAIGVLLVGAVLVLVLAARLPLPARLFTAAMDVALAAVLGVVLRQKFPK